MVFVWLKLPLLKWCKLKIQSFQLPVTNDTHVTDFKCCLKNQIFLLQNDVSNSRAMLWANPQRWQERKLLNQTTLWIGTWLGKQGICFSNILIFTCRCVPWSLYKYVCVNMTHRNLCNKLKSVHNRPTVVCYQKCCFNHGCLMCTGQQTIWFVQQAWQLFRRTNSEN